MEFRPHSHPECSKVHYSCTNVVSVYLSPVMEYTDLKMFASLSDEIVQFPLTVPYVQKHDITHWYGPIHTSYNMNIACLWSYTIWPHALNLKTDHLGAARFFYTSRSCENQTRFSSEVYHVQ
jgi:hypothetical protein